MVRERADDRAGNLSGGQRRMVEFASLADARAEAGPARRAVAGARPEGAQARTGLDQGDDGRREDGPARGAERALRAAAREAGRRDGERSRAADGRGRRRAQQPGDVRPLFRRHRRAWRRTRRTRPWRGRERRPVGDRLRHRVRASSRASTGGRSAGSRTLTSRRSSSWRWPRRCWWWRVSSPRT